MDTPLLPWLVTGLSDSIWGCKTMSIKRSLYLAIYTLVLMNACRPSDILNVPVPSGQVAYGDIQGPVGAAEAFAGARSQLFGSLASGPYGSIALSGLLADEFSSSDNSSQYNLETIGTIDARYTTALAQCNDNCENGDVLLEQMLQARQSFLAFIPTLHKYLSGSSASKIGESYALIGYTELLLAEQFCAGVNLSDIQSGGGWEYGPALSMDSLLGVAEAHLDSAIVNAHGNDTVTALASIGLGHVRLDRGNFGGADSAVTNVTPGFVYEIQMEPVYTDNAGSPNLYADIVGPYSSTMNVANREGGNGLDFISAHDPRLALDSTFEETQDGLSGLADSVMYLPLKFFNSADLVSSSNVNISSGLIPLATGIEAQLIIAEAALQQNDLTHWLLALNTLRNSGCTGAADATCSFGTAQVPAQLSGLQSLADPGTDSGRVSLMFRERAFWLFGTGTRLGDLRRLIRQYHRDQSVVYPTGAYAGGAYPLVPTYGTDVDLTLPTPTSRYFPQAAENPAFKGCLTPTSQA